MSTDPGIWGWTGDIGQLGFTVTFSLGLTPEEVLRHYGADTSTSQTLTRREAWATFPPAVGRSQLRAGTIGRWGFCFEEAGAEGIKPVTLGALSADTETISFFTARGTSRFILLKDGQGVEAFEPGLPETLHGAMPRRFWDNTNKILQRVGQTTPTPPAHAVLQVIAKHVRGLLDRTVLEGPLLTGVVVHADSAAPANPHFDSSTTASTSNPYATPVPDYSRPPRPAPEFEAQPDYSAPLSAASLQMLQELQAHIPPVRRHQGPTPADGFDRVEGARAS